MTFFSFLFRSCLKKTKMIKIKLLLILLLVLPFYGNTQEKVYNLNWKKDLVIVGAGVGLHTLGVIIKNKVAAPTIAEINALDPANINRLDRNAIGNQSANAKTISDIILYGSLSLPVIAYVIPKCRFEGMAVGLMAVEAILITNGLTNISKGLTKRYRPLTYNPNVALASKLNPDARLSFFSGHTSVTTAMSFLMASIITDVHPDMKDKYLVWSAAAIIPASIAFFRFEAGRHFPSDVMAGYALGATIGYLLPILHKQKRLQVQTYGLTGLSLNLKLNK